MKSNLVLAFVLVTVSSIFLTSVEGSWGGGGDKVLLKDIEVLTLRQGQYTKGRRSAGVPQLNCVGGSAGCGAFVPQVVQCYNRGWDGFDVQWECKTDMDNAYRFGRVEVSCEGYDGPNDRYALRGSCGLEYTIDLTKEGMAGNQHQQQHNYYGGENPAGYGWNVPPYAKKNSNFLTNMICGVVLVIMVYAFYKTCIAPNPNRQFSPTNSDYPDGRGGPGTRPPPPGFNPSYYPNSGADAPGESCSAGAGAQRQQGPAAGGFWTGAATGGFLGYLFGARNNTGFNQHRPSTSYGFGRSFGGGGSSWSGSGSSSSRSSGSSGTRTASGFGGTRMR